MSAILKFDFQTIKQLRFSEVNYLTTQKGTILHVTTTFSLIQEQTVYPFHVLKVLKF